MSFFMVNALALVLVFSSFNVHEAYHSSPMAEAPTPTLSPHYSHDHHHFPTMAPIQPPSHHHHHNRHPAPSPSPVHSPTQPPIPRSFIEVQGVVYCKSCKYSGVDTLLGATPLHGATIKLSCKNTKYTPVIETATTDKNGYFRGAAPKNVTSFASHRCKVYLVKSPEKKCSKVSNLNGGMDGAELKPAKAFIDAGKNPMVLYNVGPLAFEPTTCSH